MKVAAAIIGGDEVDNGNFQRLLASLEPHVDAVYLSYNGSKKKPPFLNSSGPPVYWEKHEWNDDFSEARQHSFSLIPRDIAWSFWIDCDDILVAPNGVQEMLESLDPYTQGVFLRYDYGHDPETGDVIVQHWRERFLSMSTRWSWRYRVHEIAHSVPGTQFARREDVWVKHQREPGRGFKVRERNRRLLIKTIKENPHTPRFDYLLANEIFVEAHLVEDPEYKKELLRTAIHKYNEFISKVGGEDDTYNANHQMADAYRLLGEHQKAIDCDLQGLKLQIERADSWNGILESLIELGEYSRAKQFADACLTVCLAPTTTQVVEPLELTYMPYAYRSVAREWLGDLEGAIEDLKIAQTYWNPTQVQERLRGLEEKAQAEPSTGPVVNIDQERKRLRGTSVGRSIAFYTRPAAEPWHPDLEAEHGMGGAETCIMRLSRRFVEDGWRVAVFGTPGPKKGVDEHGIEWWNAQDFLPNEPFTVVVGSRAPEIFDAKLSAPVKLLWLHDVHIAEELNTNSGLFGDRRQGFDAAVVLSYWHQAHTRRLYRLQNSVVIPNGIETSLFQKVPERRNIPKFVYSSSPDRGLDILLNYWEQIKERIPKAELHVYYGWSSIDAILERHPKHRLAEFKAYIQELWDLLGPEYGLNWHGRVPQHVMYNDLYNEGFMCWTYPTPFLETFCISALEHQAAGIIPITSSWGALSETVACKDLLVKGWPNNATFERQWLDLLEKVAKDPEMRDVYQQIGREHALRFEWDIIYRQWMKLIESITVHSLAKESMA